MGFDRQHNTAGSTTPPLSQEAPVSTISGVIWSLLTNGSLLLLRLYVKAMLAFYHQAGRLFHKVVVLPLEPIFVQVRKVPKKDISAEGIFYQLLRLQFLVVLFLLPYAKDVLAYAFQPVRRAYDWAVQFAKGGNATQSNTSRPN